MWDHFVFLVLLGFLPMVALAACGLFLDKPGTVADDPKFSRLSWTYMAITFALIVLVHSLILQGQDSNVELMILFAGSAFGFRRVLNPSRLSVLLTGVMATCVAITACAACYEFTGVADADNNIHHDDLTCLYFSVVTFMTVGYPKRRNRPLGDGTLTGPARQARQGRID